MPRPPGHVEIVVDDALAARLRDLVFQQKLAPGPYPAIVKMKVVRAPRGGNAFLGVVERLEFLIFTNPAPIAFSQGHYHKAFNVMVVTSEGYKVGLSEESEEWRKRLGSKLLGHLRIGYESAFKANRAQIFDTMLGQVAASTAAATRVFQQQQADMIRRAWNP